MYEAFPYFENIFPFNYESLSQFLLGFYFYFRKELESTLYCLFEFLSTSLSIWNQNIYEKFQWLLLGDHCASIYLRSVTSGGIVCYPITATSRFWMCDTICWMVLCQAFLSLLPPPPSKISSTQPLRKAWYSGYIRGAIPLYSPVNLSHPLWFWTFDSLILYITTDKINVEKSKWERVSVANCKFTHGTKLNALEVTCLVC